MFLEMLQKNNSATIHQRNLQLLDLSPEIMKDVFELKDLL